MKYRTLIEIICEAADKDEAYNIAGDYLRGQVDFGIEMRCKTAKLWEHKVMKYGLMCAISVVLFSALVLNVTPLGGDETVRDPSAFGVRNTFTMMPALKTKHRADFKHEWQTKKQEVVNSLLRD